VDLTRHLIRLSNTSIIRMDAWWPAPCLGASPARRRNWPRR
jgi:hypothetical protein